MQEVWKDVVGFEDYLRVSDLGSVFTKRSNRLVSLQTNRGGYKCMSLSVGGKLVNLRVHKMVADAFLDRPLPGQYAVRHLDDNKFNCAVENLAWGTRLDNIDDFRRNGLLAKSKVKTSGHRNGKSVLTEAQVSEIRSVYTPRCKDNGQVALASRYAVDVQTIKRVVNRTSYR